MSPSAPRLLSCAFMVALVACGGAGASTSGALGGAAGALPEGAGGPGGSGGAGGSGGVAGSGGALGGAGGEPASVGSLRFFGTGADDVDRVKIRLDAPARPIDVGSGTGAFTLELFVKLEPGDVTTTFSCEAAADGWIYGNVVLDRDIFGPPDSGDFGVSIFPSGVAFGVATESGGENLCGSIDVADGGWHHVAAVRDEGGLLRLFVDGELDASGQGPQGDASYRDGRAGAPNDPFLVLGAEKHDAGGEYPSYAGLVSELRVSSVARYAAEFSPPTAPFAPDAETVGLFHFDEGAGLTAHDVSLAPGGPSDGALMVGGPSSGPVWTDDSPF